MAAQNLDAVDLAGVAINGVILEDVMNAIYDISPIDRPFIDAIDSGEAGNQLKEWTREDLAIASSQNRRLDGSSSAGLNDTRTGERIGNRHQIMSKTVRVSDRGRNVDSIGTSDELIKQLTKRQKELRRDEEAALVSTNIAIADDGNTIAGQAAGIGGWVGVKVQDVASKTSFRGAGGADPLLAGDSSGGGGVPNIGQVAGTKRALSEKYLKDGVREAYLNGGNTTVLLSTPQAIEVVSDYLFSSSARIATIDSHASQDNRTNNGTGGGKSGGGIVAQGSVNIFVTNYATLELTPDRFMEEIAPGVSNIYLLDVDLWERCYLQGYETKELARDGLAENREITVDVSLISLNPEGNSVIADIDTTLPAVA